MNRSKDLQALLKDAGFNWTGPKLPVSGLSYDSRTVKSGDLFFAVRGAHADGHDFLPQVGQKGAVAAVVEELAPSPIPLVVVSSVHEAMASVAHHFFDRPSESLPVVGVTGTNGKTTVTYIIERILQANRKSCGVMGTINYRFRDKVVPAPNTTPLSVDVQRFLSDLVKGKADAAVMEVSSHALALHRVDHVVYQVGVFTNLTQDHLDFHKDMENYFLAKAILFRERLEIRAVINSDDLFGQRLLKECPQAISFGTDKKAGLRAAQVSCNLRGIEFDLCFPSGQTRRIANNLMGPHNVSNCLAAAGACLSLGFSEEEVAEGLNQPQGVPGRLERVEAGQDFVVVVDYAHTHDALEKVLIALKETGPKSLFCVFGAGGDRDRTKRPIMGRVAVEHATKVFLTSDNPRSEDPGLILNDIEAGIRETGRSNYEVIPDRGEAIRRALAQAGPNDIVLLAGKGHETYQIVGDQKHHFSDVEEARAALTK